MRTAEKTSPVVSLSSVGTNRRALQEGARTADEAINELRNHPSLVSAKVEVMIATIDHLAQPGRERWRQFTANPGLQEKECADLISPIFGNPAADLIYLVENLVALFADELKSLLPRFLGALAPGHQIAEEEREKRIAHQEKIKEDFERREEQLCMEMEALGVQLDRRPNLNPHVFLNFSGGSFDDEKLRRLLRYTRALAAEDAEMSRTINQALVRISNSKRELSEAERNGQLTETVRAALQKQERLLAAVKERRTEVERRRTDAGDLANACMTFLREQKVFFED